MRWVFLLVSLLSLASVAEASNPGEDHIRVKAEVDKAFITVGERFYYQVTIRHSPRIQILTAVGFPNPGEFEIKGVRDVGPLEEKGEIVEGRVFEVTTYYLGEYILEGTKIQYRNEKGEQKEVETNRLYLTVESVDKSGKEKTDIRGVKGVIGIKANRWFIWALALILGIGLGGLCFWRYLKGREARVPSLTLSLAPHEEAYQALRKLFDSPLIRQGKVKEYYDQLSDILRRYLEKRFDFPAVEETTSEIRAQLKKNGLPDSAKLLIINVLDLCDLAKFAKYIPEPLEILSTNKKAIEVIDLTRPPEVQGVADSTATAAGAKTR